MGRNRSAGVAGCGRVGWCAGVCAMVISGCGRVDPGWDYERARREVARVTGADRLFDPRHAEEVVEVVGALLEGGLTAEEAVQIALLHNGRLQAALYEIGVARADLVQAGLLSNPVLGVAFRLPAGGGLANIDMDIAQEMAELWQIPVRKRLARRVLEGRIFEIAQQAVATAMEARVAYYAARAAQERLGVAEESLRVAQQVLELTRLRREAGAGTELDVNLARGVVLEAQQAVAEARLGWSSALRRLATVLGMVLPASEIALAEPLPEPPRERIDPEAAVAVAVSRRLDLKAAREAVLAAEQAVALEYRRVFPTLEVGGAMERDARRRQGGRKLLADTARASLAAGRLTAPDIQPRSERQRGRRRDVITGPLLSVELPVFDQNLAQIARARMQYEQSRRAYEGLAREVYQEVREALDQAETAWEMARFYREQVVPQSERNLEMAQDSYRAGKASILVVLDARRTWLAVRTAYIDMLERAAVSIPRLEFAAGASLEALGRSATTQPGTGAGPTTRPSGARRTGR